MAITMNAEFISCSNNVCENISPIKYIYIMPVTIYQTYT
jgi:hypothetical protein